MTCPGCGASNDAAAEMCFTCGRSLFGLTLGAQLAGRYRILEALGKGGMGLVYRAHDQTLDEDVAIKILRPGFAEDPDVEKRFLQEIKLARKVSHRNVCRIHEYGEDSGMRYISMALVDGIDLKRVIKEKGALPPHEAYDAAIQAAEALQAIHDEGIVHRDLKPGNMIRDAKGVVRLLDFGIAKQVDTASSGGLTNTGMVVGTPDYLSPEQALGRKADARSDIYSLGAVVFELFTGQVPFRGDSALNTLQKHVQEPPPLEGPPAARLPRALIPVLRKALAKDPGLRFATARELAEALRRAHEETARALPAMVVPSPDPTVSQALTTPLPPPRARKLTPAPGPGPASATPHAGGPAALGLWLPLLGFGLLLGLWLLRGPGSARSDPPPSLAPSVAQPDEATPSPHDSAAPPATPATRPADPATAPPAEPQPTPAVAETPRATASLPPSSQPAADARRTTREGCERGDGQACLALAEQLRGAHGGPRNMGLAALAYGRACELGVARGCGAVGFMYLFGQGVEQDNGRAGMLLKRACDGGEQDACRFLEQLKQRMGRRPPRT